MDGSALPAVVGQPVEHRPAHQRSAQVTGRRSLASSVKPARDRYQQNILCECPLVTAARPVARRGSCDDDPDGEVNLLEAEYVCRGCRRTRDIARALRHHRTALRVRGTACEDEESSTVRISTNRVSNIFSCSCSLASHFLPRKSFASRNLDH